EGRVAQRPPELVERLLDRDTGSGPRWGVGGVVGLEQAAHVSNGRGGHRRNRPTTRLTLCHEGKRLPVEYGHSGAAVHTMTGGQRCQTRTRSPWSCPSIMVLIPSTSVGPSTAFTVRVDRLLRSCSSRTVHFIPSTTG